MRRDKVGNRIKVNCDHRLIKECVWVVRGY